MSESGQMDGPSVFQLVLESLPEEAQHRRAWLGLVRCFSSIERVLMRRLSDEFNSSLPRYDVLTALALAPEALTMGELASMLMVTKGNITGVVARLKKEGLVRKAASETDRRVQSVTMTKKGRELWGAMHAHYDRTVAEVLSGQSREDLRALTQVLEATRLAIQERIRALRE